MSFTQYEQAYARLQRSELAVPGSSPEMFEKAAKSDADFVFLDCEDAVVPDDKEQARKNIIVRKSQYYDQKLFLVMSYFSETIIFLCSHLLKNMKKI